MSPESSLAISPHASNSPTRGEGGTQLDDFQNCSSFFHHGEDHYTSFFPIVVSSALVRVSVLDRPEAIDSVGPQWEGAKRTAPPDSSSRTQATVTQPRCPTRATINLELTSSPPSSWRARSTLTRATYRAWLSLVLSATASSPEATMKLRRCVSGCVVQDQPLQATLILNFCLAVQI